MNNKSEVFLHPYDNVLSASLRFTTELIAWVAGPWAAGNISNWLIVPAILILVGLPATFSTINDKRQVIVPTPGPVRVLIEVFLYAVAASAPWFIWPHTAVVATTTVVIFAIVLGYPRLLWLMKGAKSIET